MRGFNMEANLNIYDLSRAWFDFCFSNPEKIKPNHTALYFFCIEHCNRLGWKDKFGLPTTMAKEAIGVHSYNTYIATLNDLIDFGFIKLIQKSTNQHSTNIIALSNFNKALDKALDKALIKHATKQSESTQQSIDSIIIQLTKYKGQLTKEQLSEIKKLLPKDKKEDVVFDMSFVANNFAEAFNLWIEYKKEIKDMYQTQKGLNGGYNELVRLSGGNPRIAIDIVNQSISRDWKGLFELKHGNSFQFDQSTAPAGMVWKNGQLVEKSKPLDYR